MALQIRRGTEAERQAMSVGDPAIGEILYITDTKKVYAGDGAVAGGILIGALSAIDVALVDTDDHFTGSDVETVLAEIGETRAENGYDDLVEASKPDLAFDNGTRTFSCSVKGGSSNFYFWVDSHKYTKTTTQSVVVPDITGTYYIVFDNTGTLTAVNQASLTPVAFYENAITGLVYWNATAGTSMVGGELHGKLMDARTHHYNHSTFGARYESGMDIEGLSEGGSTYTQNTSGFFWDEDVQHAVAAQSTAPFIYRLGSAGDWTGIAPNNQVSHDAGGSYDVWNEWTGSTWQLTEGTSSTDYWIIFYVATPDISGYPVKKIIGHNAYSSARNARAAIEDELATLQLDGLPSPEFVFLYATIVKRDGTLQALDDGSLYYDLRTLKGGAASGSSPSSVAGDVITSTTNFDGILSVADGSVQLALDTIDDHGHVAADISDFNAAVAGSLQYKGIVYIENPTAGDEQPIFCVPFGCVITRVTHITDTGTVTWNLEERSGAAPGTPGTDVYAIDVVSSSANSVDYTFANDALSVHTWLYFVASAVASSPTKLWIAVAYEKV